MHRPLPGVPAYDPAIQGAQVLLPGVEVKPAGHDTQEEVAQLG